MDYEKKDSENTAVKTIMRMIADGEISQEIAEKYFPELKESKDERMKKSFIRLVKAFYDVNFPTPEGFTREEMLAWLEKKGKQKSVNKVEPKFMVGNWVVIEVGELSKTLLITKVEKDKHLYWFNDDSYLPFTEEQSLRLWTIQDAKAGDVLETLDYILIFKELLKENGGVSYCSYDLTAFKPQFNWLEDRNWYFGKETKVHPATKKQRDILFQKMHEAGYEWDSEKLELKKIEQKPAEWSEEDEKMLDFAITVITASTATTFKKEDCVDWLKSLRPQNMWISVDEEVYVKEPVLAQKKDKSDTFRGFVVCCDHTLIPNVYERYMILGNIVSQNR